MARMITVGATTSPHLIRSFDVPNLLTEFLCTCNVSVAKSLGGLRLLDSEVLRIVSQPLRGLDILGSIVCADRSVT
eukprot:10472507-Prorocentrum_lima.AAC.1